ncbi:MAG: hypothetical protein ACOYNI_12450 [Acidimicrobiia bacterium]
MARTPPTHTTNPVSPLDLAQQFIDQREFRGAALLFEHAADALEPTDRHRAAVSRFRAALVWASIGSTGRAQHLARVAETAIDTGSSGSRGTAYRLILADHLERRGLTEAARGWRERAHEVDPAAAPPVAPRSARADQTASFSVAAALHHARAQRALRGFSRR